MIVYTMTEQTKTAPAALAAAMTLKQLQAARRRATAAAERHHERMTAAKDARDKANALADVLLSAMQTKTAAQPE